MAFIPSDLHYVLWTSGLLLKATEKKQFLQGNNAGGKLDITTLAGSQQNISNQVISNNLTNLRCYYLSDFHTFACYVLELLQDLTMRKL